MEDKILMGHGSGGKLMTELIERLIKPILGPSSIQLDDSAVLDPGQEKIAFTTDSYTITPLFFPGGDIGSLSVNGTVNDLAVMGAKPLYLSLGLILEEGLDISILERVLTSVKKASDRADVRVVTGDTKVVEKGSADRMFINTSGIGILEYPVQRREIRPGDMIVINGTIGDHGITVMAERNGLSFSRGLESDCAPLAEMIGEVLKAYPSSVKFMRDATRGGIVSVLNEMVGSQPYAARLIEKQLPLKKEVKGVCDILGIDPLYAANEGKVVMVVKKRDVLPIVDILRHHPFGKRATVIGEIVSDYPGMVYVETLVRGRRILPLPREEQLPRIC